jgi:RimJ/RimL family protein N-acetyltransferase
MVDLRDVSLFDCRFLYNLLEQRDVSVNISHKSMPTYEQHVVFIASKPYPYHKVIQSYGRSVGVIYVTPHHEVGIQIEKSELRKGYGNEALHQLIVDHLGQRLLANINPANTPSIGFFEGAGFRHIQNTYELNACA